MASGYEDYLKNKNIIDPAIETDISLAIEELIRGLNVKFPKFYIEKFPVFAELLQPENKSVKNNLAAQSEERSQEPMPLIDKKPTQPSVIKSIVSEKPVNKILLVSPKESKQAVTTATPPRKHMLFEQRFYSKPKQQIAISTYVEQAGESKKIIEDVCNKITKLRDKLVIKKYSNSLLKELNAVVHDKRNCDEDAVNSIILAYNKFKNALTHFDPNFAKHKIFVECDPLIGNLNQLLQDAAIKIHRHK